MAAAAGAREFLPTNMPALCFPPSGADAAAGPAGSADNRVPRPANQPYPGNYGGMFDTYTEKQLAAEAASGQGAAVFAGQDTRRPCGLVCLVLLFGGLYWLSRN